MGDLSHVARRSLVLAGAMFLLLGPSVAFGLPEEDPSPRVGEQSGLAGEIVTRLNDLPLSRLWDSVARLEMLGKEAVPAIREAAAGAGERAQLGASKALVTLGDEDTRQESLKRIAHLAQEADDREVRAAAIEILGREDPEGATELLRQIFEESFNNPAVCIPAAKMLWELEQDQRARSRLISLLESRQPGVRTSAALALAEIYHFEGDVRGVLRELRMEPSPRGRLASSLLRADKMARQEEREFDEGKMVLPGVNISRLLNEKEIKIRELKATIEGITASRGVSVGNPILEEVIRVIQENYIDDEKTDRTGLILRAVKGMVESLDRFSMFLDAKEAKQFSNEMKGEYYGLGLQVSKLREGGPLEVMKPIYGGVAYRLGIRSGDKILEVDNVSTLDHSQDDLVNQYLRGEEGTTVTLKVIRRGWSEPKEFTIPRQIIEVPSVYADLLPAKIGYLRLTSFGEKSAEEFEQALERLEDDGMEGLVLDVRYNPGGYLQVAIKIVDFFVGEQELPIVTQKGRGETAERSTFATPAQRPNYPMVVLINGRSASASEVVAGALKDFHRATLVGEKSFGKGSVQTIFPMSRKVNQILGGETRLRLTIQYYYLPSGRCIHSLYDENGRGIPGHEGGVEPDIPVAMERLPSWVSAEVEKIRYRDEILAYVDSHFEELRPLGQAGDRRDPSRWTDFDALYRSLDTKAEPDHVRRVLRYHLRRRLEDERGRGFPSDVQEDAQLQRAILELLSKMGNDPADLPAYAWFKDKKFPARSED